MSNASLQERMDQIIVAATLTDEAASNSLYDLDSDVILDVIEIVGGENRFHEIYKITDESKAAASLSVPALVHTKNIKIKMANGKLIDDIYNKHKNEIIDFCTKAVNALGGLSLVAHVTKLANDDGESYTEDEIMLGLYAGEGVAQTRNDAKIDARRVAICLVVEELIATYSDMNYGI